MESNQYAPSGREDVIPQHQSLAAQVNLEESGQEIHTHISGVSVEQDSRQDAVHLGGI